MGIFLMAALAYAATNTDDIFIVSLLFADAVSTRDRLCITAGRLAGILALASVSILGAGGIRAVAGRWAHLLGIVPLILGVKAVIDCTAGNINTDTGTAIRNSMFITAAAMTIASGGDNIAVYIPLLAGMTTEEIMAVLAVFTVMTLAWSCLAYFITEIPAVRKAVNRYRNIIVPAVYITLGLYILFK